LADGSFVNAMKLLQLGQQVFTIDAFAAPQLASADDLKDHPHRSVGDPATAVAGIDFLLREQRRESAIVGMALDQVFGDEHRGSAQLTVALTDQRAVGMINFITLVSRGEQPGASVDGARRGEMLALLFVSPALW
jgi:hypothetical protein